MDHYHHSLIYVKPGVTSKSVLKPARLKKDTYNYFILIVAIISSVIGIEMSNLRSMRPVQFCKGGPDEG